ncbi:hypothetical protein B1757_12265 [Acidithiobacillus marinus]|uniref:Uncharacterized protein n=1 Tax=Acidithiobacillus marinus TaxID=187490 RepID=A0A2I1DJJ5_9PROT|nr:hypothetical protein [Acidithiobacillus marinus]PKY10048.1 hypothetical protein B1757_12265 [Acidithiobacillus marinus]
MQVNIEDKNVAVSLSAREAGKIRESLQALTTVPGDLKDFHALFGEIEVPDARRGELRHEWGDPLDIDPDIGPA